VEVEVGHKVVLLITMEMMADLEVEEVQHLPQMLKPEDAELLVKEMMVVMEHKYQVVVAVEGVVLVL
jgi:hypothetical protein|tara:strand:+ start:359 stop:559 length:201 start_codon:yes stop_codon:yes gene_type:complete